MSISICTLFEGDYHYGGAALANSLYKAGFRGDIYAGYRGELPPWAAGLVKTANIGWEGASCLDAAEGLRVYFIPLKTNYHLTNYKPDFMMELLAGPAKGSRAMFYYDPDIVQTAPWYYMEEWIKCGVAVCEDVNSPLQEFHPRRMFWRRFYNPLGFTLAFKNSIYVNGGFVGVSEKDYGFIELWKRIQEEMGKEIGGLHLSIFNAETKDLQKVQRVYAFDRTDQDALNATVEGYQGIISYAGKAAMALEIGYTLLPHALGSLKPWRKEFLSMWMKEGAKPSIVDKYYWANAESPIRIYGGKEVAKKNKIIKIIRFLSRFYSK